MSGIDYIKEQYITENELSELLNVDTKRIRDLRSNHTTGKQEFINHIKPTNRSILYQTNDVFKYLKNQKVYSFGKENEESPDLIRTKILVSDKNLNDNED